MFRKTITLGLDYKEFSGGTEEINRKMKLLESEFKLASERAKEYGDESDQVRLKQEKLQQKIILQTKAVEEATKAYDKGIATKKEDAKTIDYLDKKLLDARTALQKSKNELNELNEETEKANGNNRTFGDTIRDMASKIGLEGNPAVEKLASKFDRVKEEVAQSILVVGAITAKLGKLTIAAANTADDLLTLSSISGISTDSLQKLQYASERVDVSVETMTDSMTKMIRTMGDARKGSEEASEAYKKLHVRITDASGQLRDSEEVFYEVIDALGKVGNETERDSLAMTVFGKSARELNPLIEAGSKKLKDLGIEAEDMGAVMSGKSLEELGAFKDSMDKFNATAEATKMQLGMALLPLLSGFMKVVSEIPAPVLEVVAVIGAVVAILMTVSKVVKELTALNGALAISNVAVGSTASMSAGVWGIVLVTVLGIISAILILQGLSDTGRLQNNVAKEVNKTTAELEKTTASLNNSMNKSVKHNASGTRDYEGGRTWVGEAGPEIVDLPRGSRIYSNRESRAMSGGDNYYFNLQTDSIKEYTQLVTIAKNQRRIRRMS